MVFWPARNGAGPGWFPGKFAPKHHTLAARTLNDSLPAPSRQWSEPMQSLAIVATAKPSGSISPDGMLDTHSKHTRYPPITTTVSERS